MEYTILPHAAAVTFVEKDAAGEPVTRTVAPIRDHADDSGMRLYVIGTVDGEGKPVLGDVTLKPFVPTPLIHGIAVKPAPGHETQIRPRSSALPKKRIHIAFGSIDANYRGELMSMAMYVPNPFDDKGNPRGAYPMVLKAGERVSQLIETPVLLQEPTQVASLDVTVRGAGGFGSTDQDGKQAVPTAVTG